MADELQYDLCPETGIGCVMINKDSSILKIDLMPDEAANLQELVKSGNLAGAKELLSSIEPKAETTIDGACLAALAKEIG